MALLSPGNHVTLYQRYIYWALPLFKNVASHKYLIPTLLPHLKHASTGSIEDRLKRRAIKFHLEYRLRWLLPQTSMAYSVLGVEQ